MFWDVRDLVAERLRHAADLLSEQGVSARRFLILKKRGIYSTADVEVPNVEVRLVDKAPIW